MAWEALAGLWSHPDLEKGAALVTAAGVVAAPASWAVKRRLNGRSVRKRVAEGIDAEMDDALKALDGTAGRRVMKIAIADSSFKGPVAAYRDVYYTLAFMNHDAYDAFMHAGELTALDADLLQDVQNVYQLIRAHNKYLDKLLYWIDMEGVAKAGRVDHVATYARALDSYESQLPKAIQAARKRLAASGSFWPRFGRPAFGR